MPEHGNIMKEKKKMKTDDIFNMLLEQTKLSKHDVVDYRPCTRMYAEYGIPMIPDAITMQLRNGTLVYVPEREPQGNLIRRP